MSVPGIVQSRLDGEQVAAEVSLGGEDGLYVTRTRTLVYRGDGLLSDESVEEYPHDAERIEISEGRRKSAVRLDYGIEGEEKFKVPNNRLYEALHPVLAGVLNAADVTGPEETVKQTYQFSELTLVITSERVVKHVGAAVWDEDHEEFHFDDVTALDVERGNVSSQIIIESGGRPQRIKTPSDQTREVRERIERALLEYHGASSYDEFARERTDAGDRTDAERDADSAEQDADPLTTGGVDPIDADPPELDDDGAIVESEASVTTGERPGDDADPVRPDEDSEAAEATAGEDATASAENADGPASGRRAEADPERDDSASGAAVTDTHGPTEGDTGEATGADAGEATGADAGGTAGGADTETEAVAERATEADATAATGEAGPTAGADAGDGFADSGFRPASSELERDATDEQLAALTEAVERQNELLAQQQRTLERLIEELRRGR